MWDQSVTLMHQKEGKADPDGFAETEHEICMEHVPARIQDITRNDQILANQSGYEIDQNIEIMACNYHNEALLMDEKTGNVYEVMRTFRPDRSKKIVLTCRRMERGTMKGEVYGAV